MTITNIAHAKLNLFLHILGKRPDNYHMLDSLFVFTEFGDTITLSPSDTLSISIDGPYKSVLQDCPIDKNLAYRAAKLLKQQYHVNQNVHISLIKNIPVCAGIGGGSANAAAVMQMLNQLWELNISPATMKELALTLGADVPACLSRNPLLVSGIGEAIKPVDIPHQDIYVLLINPQVPLVTADIFKQYALNPYNTPASVTQPEKIPTQVDEFFIFLQSQRNDLTAIASSIHPIITTIINEISLQSNCILARMSGSGPTCFGLFTTEQSAQRAKDNLTQKFPNFWCQTTMILNPT